jgi:hypothetical protein
MVEYLTSDIIYEKHKDFLLIKYNSYNSMEEFYYSLEKALKICKEKKYSNLILDIINVDFKKISFTDKYDGSEKIAELFGYPNKIAVLAPKKYHDSFSEDVAANRGANIKGFQDMNDAINWIRE